MLVSCSSGDEASDATTSSTTTTLPVFEGDPDSPFCAALREVDLSAISPGDESPDAVRTQLDVILDAFARLRPVAPPEIAEDVALVGDGVAAVDEALAQVGYDFDALASSGQAEAFQAAVNDPAFAEAGVRLATYRSQVCELR